MADPSPGGIPDTVGGAGASVGPPDGKAVGARRVLIVGGSTRAAAWSAIRAGFQPVCADLFADQDTRQIAEVIPVRRYPDSLPDDVANVRADGWFYTGALENRVDLIEEMSRAGTPYGPLWGTPAPALTWIRDPGWVCRRLNAAGAPALQVRHAPPAADGTWMRKPLASAGGRAITVWDAAARHIPTTEPVYFQQRQFGTTLSALYRCGDDRVQFLGMTRQGIDQAVSLAAEPFLYSGSVGPIVMPADPNPPEFVQQLTGQLRVLTTCGLQGLIGVDFILDSMGTPWIVEVNPRYTASIEVVELACGRSLLTDTPHPGQVEARERPVVGKAILYSPRSLTAPDMSQLRGNPSAWDVPSLADMPVPGSRVEASWPLCSVLARGQTRDECLSRLKRRAEDVWQLISR